MKLNLLPELRGPLPAFVAITEAKHGDAAILDQMAIDPGSLHELFLGYFDLRRLFGLATAGAFFIVRERSYV